MTTWPDTVAYPFNEAEGLELADAYAAASEAAGMVRVRLPYGEPAWLATRYADARLVLGDRRFSRSMARTATTPRLTPATQDSGIMSMDPPEHTRLRVLVAKAFTLRRVEMLRPRVRELAESLLDDMVALGQPADLVENFTLPLPVGVICEMLGAPAADRPKFQVWTHAAFSTGGIPTEQSGANEEFRAYMSALIDLRRREPADDLMTALIEARDEQDRLSELELIDLCNAILVGGHETTSTQLSNFCYILFQNPDLLAELRADPSLLPAAVEELTRFVPLASGVAFARYATEDIEVGGVLVRAGEPVLAAFNAANRDALRFENPDEIRFDRPDNQHIGFGHGAHHCLGAQLAKVELQEGLRALLDRMPDVRLAGDIGWKTEMIVRGPRTMPIAW